MATTLEGVQETPLETDRGSVQASDPTEKAGDGFLDVPLLQPFCGTLTGHKRALYLKSRRKPQWVRYPLALCGYNLIMILVPYETL